MALSTLLDSNSRCELPLFFFFVLAMIILKIYTHIKSTSTSPSKLGYHRIGLPQNRSNIRDEYDPTYYSQPQDSYHIKALFIYPIKSCAGIELNVANVIPQGIEYDRIFCFAETAGKEQWEARTMRNGQFSKLALVRPEIWLPADNNEEHKDTGQGIMTIWYPRIVSSSRIISKLSMMLGIISRESSFQIPLSPSMNLPVPRVKIWKDNPLAHDYGQYIPSSFTDFIYDGDEKKKMTILRTYHNREIYRNAPRKETLGFQPITGFADAYPLHLLNIASVQDVARRCEIPLLTLRRFRANLIISGPPAFDEDDWKCIRIGSQVIVHTVAHTIRCRLPNVDPDTGIRHPSEPDKTMRSYRCIDPGEKRYACLGMQLVPAQRGIFFFFFFFFFYF